VLLLQQEEQALLGLEDVQGWLDEWELEKKEMLVVEWFRDQGNSKAGKKMGYQ
jgi:hypothetical protein